MTIRITAESKIQRIHIHVCTGISSDDSQMLKKVVHVKALEENAHCVCPAWAPRLSAHQRIAGWIFPNMGPSLPASGALASCARMYKMADFVCRLLCRGCPSSPPWRSPPLSARRCLLAVPPSSIYILARHRVAWREQPPPTSWRDS